MTTTADNYRERLELRLPDLPSRPQAEMWIREDHVEWGVQHTHMIFSVGGMWIGRVLTETVDGGNRITQPVELQLSGIPQGYAPVSRMEMPDDVVRDLLTA